MIGTEVFHRNFSQLSHFSTPLVGTRTFFRGGWDGGFSQKFFRNSANLRPSLSARENFSRGDDRDGGFSQNFSQFEHFSTPFIDTRKNFRSGRDGDFSQKVFRNSAILRPHLSARGNFFRGGDDRD